MTSENADRCRSWNSDEEAQEAEQLSESEEREHQPDGMKADQFAHELRREHISLKELSGSNNAQSQERTA